MANLISVSLFSGYDGDAASVAVSPSLPFVINTSDIQSVRAITENPTVPGVNTLLQVRYVSGNATLVGNLLVNETAAAITTAANAALS